MHLFTDRHTSQAASLLESLSPSHAMAVVPRWFRLADTGCCATARRLSRLLREIANMEEPLVRGCLRYHEPRLLTAVAKC